MAYVHYSIKRDLNRREQDESYDLLNDGISFSENNGEDHDK